MKHMGEKQHVRTSGGSKLEAIFESNVAHAAAHVARLGRLPRKTAQDADERKAGDFLGTCRQAAQGRGSGAGMWSPERKALLDKHVPGWADLRGSVFEMNVAHAAAQVTRLGRLPRLGSADPGEVKAARFLDRCRLSARGKPSGMSTWTQQHKMLLDTQLPGWDELHTLAERFEANVAHAAAQVARLGRIPRGRAGDVDERRAGVFLGHCRRAIRGQGHMAGAWTPQRKALLDRHVPGWDDPRGSAFEANVAHAAAQVARLGRIPRGQAGDVDERKSGVFLDRCRSSARGKGNSAGAWTPQRKALLDERVPGWDLGPH